MSFPVYIHFGALRLHPHWIFETLAYALAFRLYLGLRRRQGDALDDANRWWIIAAAAAGAAVGSKVLYWFEDPRLTLLHCNDPLFLLGGKTMVGALIGGLLVVEWAKTRLGIARRTGDLFAVPLCVGIAVGRIGCFLTGVEDHTAGIATALPWSVNFGDGVLRHPAQPYEVLFAMILGVFLWHRMRDPHGEGDIFRMFMFAYVAFRLACDFLKPGVRVHAGLTSIQWACVAMVLYYSRDCLPRVAAPAGLAYQNIFRVLIVQFLDAHAFDVRSVKKTCIHIVHPDGRLIPFDTYNLFYRDDLERTRLTPLRQRFVAPGPLLSIAPA
jgi:phosphatidylglycerol---prolipoprotein diacylglyceryl transferase